MTKVIKLFDDEEQTENAVNRITKINRELLEKEVVELIKTKHSCLMAEDLWPVFYAIINRLEAKEKEINENLRKWEESHGKETDS